MRIRAGFILVATSLVATLGSLADPAAAVTPTVTFAVSNTAPDVGQTVTLSGTVSPNRAGQAVTIQRYTPETGTWRSVAYPTLNSLSRFSLSRMPTLPGVYKFRVVYAGVKVVKSFTAYRWRYLLDLDKVDSYGCCGHSGILDINGQTYTRTISEYDYFSAGDRWAEWNLKRSCTTFRAVLGVSDDSRSGSRYVLAVFADAIPRHEQQYSLGESRALSVSVSGALRVRLSFTKTAELSYSYGAFGNARIRCSW